MLTQRAIPSLAIVAFLVFPLTLSAQRTPTKPSQANRVHGLLRPMSSKPQQIFYRPTRATTPAKTHIRLESVVPTPALAPVASTPTLAQAPVGTGVAPQPTILQYPANPVSVNPSHISIVPQQFEEGLHGNYTVEINNSGPQNYESLLVELAVPETCQIHQVTPKPVSLNNQKILVRIDELGPGQKEIVTVAASMPDGNRVSFAAQVVFDQQELPKSQVAPAFQISNQTKHPPARLASTIKAIQPAPVAAPAVSTQPVSTQPVSTQPVSTQPVSTQPPVRRVATAEPVPRSLLNHEPITTTTDWTMAPNASIKTVLTGPKNVTVGTTTDYQIEIANTGATAAQNVVIQLSIPVELEITVLDRNAWFDEQSRKLTWELPSLAAGQTETIQYKAVMTTQTQMELSTVTGMSNSYQGSAQLIVNGISQ